MKRLVGLLAINGLIITLSGCGVVGIATCEPSCSSYSSGYVTTVGYYPTDYYVGYGAGYWGNPGYYNNYYYLGY